MPESLTQPDKPDIPAMLETREPEIAASPGREETHATGVEPATDSSTPVIWTPRFIIIFAATVFIALTTEGLLTQGVVNNGIAPVALGWILLGHIPFIVICWALLMRAAKSPWMRLGATFGGIWSLFASIGFVLNALALDPTLPLMIHLQAATNTALLASYVCLSAVHTPFHRWDGWFFRLSSIVGACAVALIYFLLPSNARSSSSLEITTSLVMLFMSMFAWWLRPSCWRTQPGPTLLFGITPFLLLILAIPGVIENYESYFYAQIALLTLLLGVMRLIQSERQNIM